MYMLKIIKSLSLKDVHRYLFQIQKNEKVSRKVIGFLEKRGLILTKPNDVAEITEYYNKEIENSDSLLLSVSGALTQRLNIEIPSMNNIELKIREILTETNIGQISHWDRDFRDYTTNTKLQHQPGDSASHYLEKLMFQKELTTFEEVQLLSEEIPKLLQLGYDNIPVLQDKYNVQYAEILEKKIQGTKAIEFNQQYDKYVELCKKLANGLVTEEAKTALAKRKSIDDKKKRHTEEYSRYNISGKYLVMLTEIGNNIFKDAIRCKSGATKDMLYLN